ncbi:MAG: PQQ-binding-like beta-propeller repeat protein, partial [Gemmataceae bacterium]
MNRLLPRLLIGLSLLLGVVAVVVYLYTSRLNNSHVDDDKSDLKAQSPTDGPTWTRYEPALEPTWPDQPNFTTDAVRQPVIADGKVLLTSSRHDDLTAADASTGKTVWRFQAEGPIRFAPAVWKDYVYVSSDDGYLYCLALEDGSLRWKVRGGPSEQLVLGNERLINLWPARGGPVIAEETENGQPTGKATVYFAAGIWPFMGIFLHALDAQTGQVIWTNSGDGATFIKQPHNTDAFAGVAPQGQLQVHGPYLLVPGGRSVPAIYDRHSGVRLHYRLAESGKIGGGPDILVLGDTYINGSGVFSMQSGRPIGSISGPVATNGTHLFSIQAGVCRVFDLRKKPALEKEAKEIKASPDTEPAAKEPTKDSDSGAKEAAKDAKDAKAARLEKQAKAADKASDKSSSKSSKSKSKRSPEAWIGKPKVTVEVPTAKVLLATGDRLYGAGDGLLFCVEQATTEPKLAWKKTFAGKALRLAYAEGTLFVSTQEGYVHAFGPEAGPRTTPPEPAALPATSLEAENFVRELLATTGEVREGYAIVSGLEQDHLISLYKNTRLNLLVFEPDAAKAQALRTLLREANLDTRRWAVRAISLDEAKLPPYLATRIVLAQAPSEATRKRLIDALRPYGGTLCVRSGENQWDLVRREGPLPGSANWTHQNANAANTRVGGDTLVKAPLGVLWFGGPGNQDILPRHGHGPSPQVVDGRCIVEGMDMLRAIDVYTGRLLWTAKLPGLGQLYDNTAHQAGANGIGSNYVSLPEGIFVAHENRAVRLDPETGREVQTYRLPLFEGENQPPRWAFLNVEGDYLIGAASPAPKKEIKRKKGDFTGLEASKRVCIFHWRTGELIATIHAEHGYRHNGIVLGGGRLYLLDRTDKDSSGLLAITGTRGSVVGSIAAYDLKSGKEVWKNAKGTFGTFLSYSQAHDILLESGLITRDTLRDEAKGIRALNAKDGQVLWNKPAYTGPAMVRGDWVLKTESRGNGGTACDIRTGEEINVPDPITGKPVLWKWERTYGCNTPAASEHLILFRSGAAGFYDLCGEGGTGNLGGFRSSCTLNLIPANGVLVAPDYTRTCVCNYQNQTSIAFIHWPDNELWTFTTARTITAPVRKLGVNFGAPGSRKDDKGTLWVEYPRVGGPSPRLGLTTFPEPESADEIATFRLHASQVNATTLPWVYASGIKEVQQIRLPLGLDNRQRTYTVRLHFLEPEAKKPGERVFQVALQDDPVLETLDIAKEAGGPGKPLVKEFKG